MPAPLDTDSPQRARARNRRLVLDEVRKSAPVTRTQLGTTVGLAKSTIKEICDGLVADGLVEELPADTDARRQGRPALPLQISSRRGHLLGIDVGADKVISRVTTLGGQPLATVRTRTRCSKPSRDQTLKTIGETARAALAQAGVGTDSILTTVVGTPGVVDPTTELVTLAPQIDDWEGIHLSALVARELALPKDHVLVERQADLSTIAEARGGAAKDTQSALYVHLGIGIGSGIITGGELYKGFSGAAGEIGYMPHNFGDLAPPDSGFGPLEWAAGGHAFARHGREAALDPSGARLRELAGGDPNRVDAEVVFTAAREGDRTATLLVERLVGRIAVGIASVVCVLNPQCVIIAGGMSRAGGLLLHLLENNLKSLVPVVPELRLSAFGDEGAVVGALYRAADHTFDRLSPI
jgi:glucokinase